MGHMNLSMPDELLAALKQAVPIRQRSTFIAQAIREKLALLEQVRALQETAGTWSDQGRTDPSREIRASRESWSERTGGGESGS